MFKITIKVCEPGKETLICNKSFYSLSVASQSVQTFVYVCTAPNSPPAHRPPSSRSRPPWSEVTGLTLQL